MYYKGFYKELFCFPEAPAVIENLQRIGFKVKILSSCIDTPYCKAEKSKGNIHKRKSTYRWR